MEIRRRGNKTKREINRRRKKKEISGWLGKEGRRKQIEAIEGLTRKGKIVKRVKRKGNIRIKRERIERKTTQRKITERIEG